MTKAENFVKRMVDENKGMDRIELLKKVHWAVKEKLGQTAPEDKRHLPVEYRKAITKFVF